MNSDGGLYATVDACRDGGGAVDGGFGAVCGVWNPGLTGPTSREAAPWPSASPVSGRSEMPGKAFERPRTKPAPATIPDAMAAVPRVTAAAAEPAARAVAARDEADTCSPVPKQIEQRMMGPN